MARTDYRIANNAKYCKTVDRGVTSAASKFDRESVEAKREEIRLLVEKYSIRLHSDKIYKYYLTNIDLKCGNILNSANFLNLILSNIFEFNEEEISLFLNKNVMICMSQFGDFKARLAIFNHIGLLEDVIFHGSTYLTHDFTKSIFGTYTLYAIIMANNISSIEELNEVISKTPEKTLAQLRKKYPLTPEVLEKYNDELKRNIKRAARRLYLKQRIKSRGDN